MEALAQVSDTEVEVLAPLKGQWMEVSPYTFWTSDLPCWITLVFVYFSRETHNSHRPSQAPRARSRCPVKKKAQPPAPVSAASNGSNKNGSSDKDKGCSPQDAQQKSEYESLVNER